MSESASTGQSSDFLFPNDLFDEETGDAERFWICIRARPRWEKKLCRWLRGRGIPNFLPVYAKQVVSHRKRRTTLMPLFPGYVFAAQDVPRSELNKSGSVVRILKPTTETEAKLLDSQLHALWLAIRSGQPIAPLLDLSPGQRVEITEGPMRGTEGIYLRDGRRGSLVVSVDLLATAVTIELPPESRVQILD